MKSDLRSEYIGDTPELNGETIDRIECAALGCVLLDPDIAERNLLKLPVHFFSDLRNREVRWAMEMLVLDGKAVDTLLICHVLKENNRLDKAGGFPYVSALADKTPTAANLDVYLPALRKQAEIRKLSLVNDTLADLLKKGRTDARTLSDARDHIEAIMDRAGTPIRRLPEISDCFHALQNPPPKPAELIEGLFHKSTKLVLGGSSKSYKTWSLMDMSVSIATGADWWGLRTLPGRILYINFEIPESFFLERLAKIVHAKGVELKAGQFDHWPLRGYATDIETILSEFIRRISDKEYSAIAIDPTYKLMGSRNENDAGDIASLLNGFERIAHQTGAGVLFGAHYSKGNQAQKDAMDRISGSGVFGRDPDTILAMTEHEEKDSYVVEPKLRNLPPMAPFVIRWAHPLFTATTELDPKRLKQGAGRPKEHDPEELLAIIENESLTSTDWFDRIAPENGISKRTFFREVKSMMRSGSIIKSAVSGKWSKLVKKTP